MGSFWKDIWNDFLIKYIKLNKNDMQSTWYVIFFIFCFTLQISTAPHLVLWNLPCLYYAISEKLQGTCQIHIIHMKMFMIVFKYSLWLRDLLWIFIRKVPFNHLYVYKRSLFIDKILLYEYVRHTTSLRHDSTQIRR